MPEEAESSLSLSLGYSGKLEDSRCTNIGILPDSKVSDVSGIRDPKDFTERPRVK